jgi:UDP-3-O-[3-hydroxymyristoyl] N-acetylglucosamine deacetylase
MFWAQKTLKSEVVCTGVGLHSGRKVRLKILPAPPNTGITFKRVDLPKQPEIKAHMGNVVDSHLATTIGKNGVIIRTVEHLLAAFLGMGVDNAIVELDAPEVPIMDGSAGPFVYLIKNVGLKAQFVPKKILLLKRPFWVKADDRWIRLRPHQKEGLKIHFVIDFDHPLLRKQAHTFIFSLNRFEKEVSRARTFGFLKDVDGLQAQGLAQGGSLDNAIIIDRFRVLNKEGLRYKNEFVRHKILDLLGDLSLLGHLLVAQIEAYKAGHILNHNLARHLWQDRSLIEVVTLPSSQPTMLKKTRLILRH